MPMVSRPTEIELLMSNDAPYASVEEETVPETEAVSEETQPAEDEQITYENGDYADGVYEIQSELIELGYFNDDATGYYGDMTESAVLEFQTQNGLEPTGQVDELTYAAIFSSTALENPNAETLTDTETLTPPQRKIRITKTTTKAQLLLPKQ